MIERATVEDFLFHEAALLDAWQLEAWLALWTADARYIVPTSDAPDADPRTALALIADDHALLRSRVEQLLRGSTWAEVPRSRTTRILGNVRILAQTEDGRVRATANGIVHRCHRDRVDVLAGRWDYELVVAPEGTSLAIREKRVTLTQDALAAGRISILL
jgi:p-cumate 2,3-dioxygenase beta subunit